MTHGDKTKAKTVKSSKASGQQKAGGESGEARKAGGEKGNGKTQTGAKAEAKGGSKASGEVQTGAKKSGAEKAAALPEKSSRSSATQKEAGEKRGRGAAVAAANDGPFTNAGVGDSFARAIKKYPNAFRRLTD